MTFKVILTDPAFNDADEAAEFIAAESPSASRRWLIAFWEAIDSIKEMPFRAAIIPEAESVGIPYRGLLLDSHRIIYRIDELRSVVYVIRIYHGARRPLMREDLLH